jgi:TP901 family phage tail tape measure protein
MIKIGYDGSGVGMALAGLGGLVTSVMAVGQAINTFIIDPLMKVGSAAVGVAADFESQMAILGLASKTLEDGMDDLEEVVLAVGGDTRLVGISASGAAEAMTNFYKAGLVTEEVLGDVNAYMEDGAELGGALKAAIDLAAASELSLAEASDVVAVAMATFGLDSDEAIRIGNSFVQSADASVASVGELADALRNVGPTAAAFGWGLEDTNTALALLSERGIKGSEAGTALKSMMTNIMRPTNDVQDALKALNVELYDEEGVMRSLPDIMASFEKSLYGTQTAMVEVGGRTKEQNDELARLSKRYASTERSISDYEKGITGAGLSEAARGKKIAALRAQLAATGDAMTDLQGISGDYVEVSRELTEEERNRYIQTLAGTFGMKAMNTLLAEGTTGWEEMATGINEAATAQEVAAVMADTYQGSVEALEGVLETLLIQVGKPLIDEFLRPMADWLAVVATEQGPGLIAWIRAAAAVVGPFLMETADWLMTKLPQAVQVVADYWETVLVPAFEAAQVFLQTYVMPILAVLGEWFMMALPIAIQVFVDYYNNYLLPIWASIAEQWETVIWPALSKLMVALQERLPGAFAFLAKAWETFGAPMFAFFGGIMADYIIPFLGQLFVWIAEYIPAAMDTQATFWETVLWPAISTVWEWIQGTLIPGFVTVLEWLDTTLTAGLTILATFWEETLLPAITAVWTFIDEDVIPLFESVQDLFEVILVKAIEILVAAWENVLLPALEDLWEFVEQSLQPVLDTLLEYWETSLKPAIEVVADIIETVLIAAWDKLVAAWEKLEVLEKIKKAFDDIKDALESAKTWVDKVKTAIENIKIPSWLEGKSPPPMANWFSDISDAVEQLAAAELPMLQSALDIAAPDPSLLGAGTSSSYREGDINIEAKYAYQDERTLREDVQMMRLREEAIR